MDLITRAIVAAGAVLFGGVGAASAAGSPRAKDPAFDRAQAKREAAARDRGLEAQLLESQLAGAGYRAAPPDTQGLQARLRAEAFRAYYFGDRGG